MAQPNPPISENPNAPNKLGNVKHRTATLDGIHNKNKALYRLGVTAAEIHRAKALQTMGGSEDTYQQSLLYLNRNHQPTVSHSFNQNPIKPRDRFLPSSKQDPLENEYTHHSHTAETIDQSLLEKRESASYSITWTHSQNQSHHLQRSNKSNISTEADEDHEDKKDESLLIKGLKSISLESDSRSDKHHDARIIDDIFNEKINENTPCMIHDAREPLTTQDITIHKAAHYAQDDVNNDTNPIVSKKLFSKRKSDSFFMNNRNVIVPRIYHRKYEPKKPRKMNINHTTTATNVDSNKPSQNHTKEAENRKEFEHVQKTSTPKDWYQFSDEDQIQTILHNKYPNTNSVKLSHHHEMQSPSDQKQREATHGYQSRRKIRNRNRNRNHTQNTETQFETNSNKPRNDIAAKVSDAATNTATTLRLKPSKAKPSKEEQEEKQKERDRWKQNRELRGYHPDTSDVINSSAKVLKFFGDNPQSKTKVNWKVGASLDEIMRMRSLGLVNITEKDDEMRKKERNAFSRKSKFIQKISQIKLKWGSKANTSRNNLHDIESKNFLNHCSLSDVEDDHPMNKTIQDEIESDHDINTMIVSYRRNRSTEPNPRPQAMLAIQIPSQEDTEPSNDAYHIDQSLFTFQNPHGPSKSDAQLQRKKYKDYDVYTSSYLSSRFLNKRQRKKNDVLGNKYGFKPNGKINVTAINQQTHGLRKLLAEKKTLLEIIYIYYQQYGFCIEFIVYLIATMDETCPQYVSVISRHVDKQIKILHGLSIWQYILRHQLPHLDIKRFFYSFGPLIGKYKTLISPLHLSARKLMDIGGGKESHITSTTSSPECVYAFEIFKWLLFIGYDIDDGDVGNLITPQTILNHAPRILKQILSYQRQFLFKQRQCMKAVDNVIYRKYKLLLDDDILQVIEKFTYNKYRRTKTGFGHKKFVK